MGVNVDVDAPLNIDPPVNVDPPVNIDTSGSLLPWQHLSQTF